MENKIVKRCGWCKDDALYIKYHDEEWGKRVTDDRTLFEFLILEGAQAGLSWITVLRKREGYKKAFANFDFNKVAKYTANDVDRLMLDEGIVRNRRKIESTIVNAQHFIQIQKDFISFDTYILSFFPKNQPIVNNWQTLSDVPAYSKESDAISKDMKKRGFKFFGTTICYAFLQATGYVDDHIVDCHCRTHNK